MIGPYPGPIPALWLPFQTPVNLPCGACPGSCSINKLLSLKLTLQKYGNGTFVCSFIHSTMPLRTNCVLGRALGSYPPPPRGKLQIRASTGSSSPSGSGEGRCQWSVQSSQPSLWLSSHSVNPALSSALLGSLSLYLYKFHSFMSLWTQLLCLQPPAIQGELISANHISGSQPVGRDLSGLND